MSGSLLFICVFMVTDPITAPKKPYSLYVYGAIIGFTTILIRTVSPSFPEGVSFSIILGNTFSNILDELMPAAKKKNGQ